MKVTVTGLDNIKVDIRIISATGNAFPFFFRSCKEGIHSF